MTKSKKILVAAIITVSAVLAIASSWRDSLIVDEVPHIGAGYSYLIKHDMRLNPEHPPLAKDLAGIALSFLNLNQKAFQSSFWQTEVNGQWDFGRLLIFDSGNNADLIKHVARLPMILFFIFAAIIIFTWGKKLYGEIGAFLALILFAFSPTIITHSRFVTTDMPALFGVLSATYFFIKYLKNQNWKNLIVAGLFFGIAILLKFSTFLLAPFFLGLGLVYGIVAEKSKAMCTGKNLACTILIMIIGFLFVVWPVYYFNTYNYPALRQQADTRSILTMVYGDSFTKFSPFLNLEIQAAANPILRPFAEYGLGFLRVLHQTSEPHEVYFLGKVNLYGDRSYFPIVYFLKEPLAWWGFVLIAVLFLAWQLKRPSKESFSRGFKFLRNHFDEFAMLVWLAVYWYTSIGSTFNIGVRHLLPTYPFAILLVSGQIARIFGKIQNSNIKYQKFGIWALVFGLLGWYVYSSVHTYPNYLSYFNESIGGPSQAYKYVVDSNLDWGQDLIRFSDWVKQNDITKIETDYFGWANPYYYMGNRYIPITSMTYSGALDFKERNHSNGWLAVSATFLQSSIGAYIRPQPARSYEWLHTFTPVTTIGNSIFIYHIK
jgi:dolichyl-phosphate-mannose--protein O-mannosyl transferase